MPNPNSSSTLDAKDKTIKKKRGESTPAATGFILSTDKKKGKRKKRKRDEVDAGSQDEADQDSKATERSEITGDDDTNMTSNISKKKRKNKTGFPNPDDDASLTDQSQKCLSYAFLQFHKPSKWKFNKARQNWLVRNFLLNETVPEAYLPLALEYLAKIQGRARENLLQSCQTILEPKEKREPEEKAEQSEPQSLKASEGAPATEAEQIKILRAQALLDLFNTPGSLSENLKDVPRS